MLDKITNNILKKEKHQWELDIAKDIQKLDDEDKNVVVKHFPLKEV